MITAIANYDAFRDIISKIKKNMKNNKKLNEIEIDKIKKAFSKLLLTGLMDLFIVLGLGGIFFGTLSVSAIIATFLASYSVCPIIAGVAGIGFISCFVPFCISFWSIIGVSLYIEMQDNSSVNIQ